MIRLSRTHLCKSMGKRSVGNPICVDLVVHARSDPLCLQSTGLSELAVHGDYLGKGAAKLLMRFVIDEAEKMGLSVGTAVVPGR